MTEAAKMKPVKSVEDFIAAARKTTTTPTAEVKKEESTQDFAGIQNNTFYKILLDPSLSPTEKKEATAISPPSASRTSIQRPCSQT